MSQHDYNIANGGGAAVRADINNALLAILSQNSGATAPTTTKPFMPWYDTATGVLKIRNAADSAWVTFAAGAIADASIAQAKLAAGVAGNGPAFSAYSTVGASTPNATYTKIPFDSEEFDTNSNFASSRFTPTVAGYYRVNAAITGGFATQILTIYKNGAEYKRGAQSVGGSMTESTVSALVYCNGSTDYVEVYWYQASGSTQTSGVGQALTYFQGFLARAA